MVVKRCVLVLGMVLAGGCSSSSAKRDQQYTILKPGEQAPPQGGIPADKQLEIQLVLQQRDPSVRKCYQDVLNEKQDRNFQGTVKVLIGIDPSGTASSVQVVGGTLADESVRRCLVDTIKEFAFPQLANAGQVQYEYVFRPAY